MNKKEYILKILNALLDARPLAQDLKVLVNSGTLNDESIDALVNIFQKTIQDLKGSQNKEKLEKSMELVQKVKDLEHGWQEQVDHDEHIDKLLTDIK